ncbi:MAG: hypothetical protein HON70_02320 [Lentisphaerae bacterium]|nr:hypothetical protein [Lentisphaerota bacterium]
MRTERIQAIAHAALRVSVLGVLGLVCPVRADLIIDDFESGKAGERPAFGLVIEEGAATARITDRLAASGKHAVEFRDAANVTPWKPHICVELKPRPGEVHFACDVLNDQSTPALLKFEFRDWSNRKHFLTGPQVQIDPKGTVIAGTREIGRIPLGQWMHLDITFRHGPGSANTFDVALKPYEGKTITGSGIPFESGEFGVCTWFGVTGMSQQEAVFLIDNIELAATADRLPLTNEDVLADLPLDEGMGTEARDRSGNGNHGGIFAHWVKGAFGEALRMNGFHGVSLPDTPALTLGELPFAVEAWIAPEQLDRRIVERRVGRRRQMSLWALHSTSAGEIALILSNRGRNRWYRSQGNARLTVGEWNHVVVSVAPRKRQVAFVLNGEPAGTSSLSSMHLPALQIAGNIMLGGHYAPFRGLMGRVRIHNRAVTADEAQRAYASGLKRYTSTQHTLNKGSLPMEDASRPMPMRIRGVEARPASADPEQYIQYLVETRCNVSTVGSMFGTGWALFPTDRLPIHPKMDPEWLPAVLKEAHKHGIRLTCWNCFNIQDTRRVEDFQIAKRFPQWAMEYIKNPAREYPPRVGMCLLSSPYIQHHAEFMKEVVRQGVDAMWFDGVYLGGAPHPLQPGCVCAFCRDQFRRDYGLDLPKQVDWTDLTFKKWVRWRNEKLIATATHFADEIRSESPGMSVTFNYNMWPFGTKDWQTGIPLWKTSAYGVSQHAYSGSDNLRWVMLGYKGRLTHDLNPDHSDMWRTGDPSFSFAGSAADEERYERNMNLFVLAGPTYGTIPWRSRRHPQVIRKGNDLLADVEAYFSKEQIRHTGVVHSQNTHDFWGHLPGTDNLIDYRDAILGTWLLLTENHMPFEFVFDNQLGRDDLKGYEALVLPNMACVSDPQADTIRDWVNDGGHLVLTGSTGQFDEWGEARQRHAFRDWTAQKSTVAGKGRVDYVETDPGLVFGRQRNQRPGKTLLAALQRPTPPFGVTAPPYVAVNAFWNPRHDEIWVHLLNASYFYMHGKDCGFRGVNRPPTTTQDLASDGQMTRLSAADDGPLYKHRPVQGITVAVNRWSVAAARTVRSTQTLEIRDGRVVLPELDLHEVIVLKLRR